PETLPEEKRSESSVLAVLATFKGLLRDKVFMGVALTQGFIMASMFAYIAGSPFVLQNIYGVTPFQFSLFFALNGIGIIMSAQLAGKLSSSMAESTILLRAVQVAFTASLFLLVVIWQQLPLWAMATALFFIRSEEHTSELQSRFDLVCRLLLEKKNTTKNSSSMLNKIIFFILLLNLDHIFYLLLYSFIGDVWIIRIKH